MVEILRHDSVENSAQLTSKNNVETWLNNVDYVEAWIDKVK